MRKKIIMFQQGFRFTEIIWSKKSEREYSNVGIQEVSKIILFRKQSLYNIIWEDYIPYKKKYR